MKYILIAALFFSACAGKASPLASGSEKAELLRLNVAIAIDHSVDGIIVANDAEWLNDKDTVLVLKSLHVALESVRTSNSPVETVVAAVQDIKRQIGASSVARWNPYLDALTIAVLGFTR